MAHAYSRVSYVHYDRRDTPPMRPQVLADGYQATKDGLIFKDFDEGQGPSPSDGQVNLLTLEDGRSLVMNTQMVSLQCTLWHLKQSGDIDVPRYSGRWVYNSARKTFATVSRY